MSNNCKPCKDNIFKNISSNPEIADIFDAIKDIEVVGDDVSIFVDKIEQGDVTTFRVNYSPYIPLSINSFSDNLGLQVKGVTITNFTLDWVYNKPVQLQTLNQGLTAPIATASTSYSLNVTGQNITDNITFTLTADDDTFDNRAAKTSTNTITFGNYIYRTQIEIADRDNITESDITTLDLPNLNRTLTTNKNLTFTSSSNSLEYEVILMPSSFNLTSGGSFQDLATNFTGGWGKLFDVNLTNDEGFTEEYGVWVSSNKNLSGLTFRIN